MVHTWKILLISWLSSPYTHTLCGSDCKWTVVGVGRCQVVHFPVLKNNYLASPEIQQCIQMYCVQYLHVLPTVLLPLLQSTLGCFTEVLYITQYMPKRYKNKTVAPEVGGKLDRLVWKTSLRNGVLQICHHLRLRHCFRWKDLNLPLLN